MKPEEKKSKKKKALEFDEIANGVFFPIYAVLASQVKESTGITAGHCLDMGSGGGHFGLCIAEITDMDVTLMDHNEHALEIARNRANDWGLEGRIKTLVADACEIPLADETVDLVVSRGSLWFWSDQKAAFKEIYRVLRPGGIAQIGGGFGTIELKEEIDHKMKLRDPDWPESRLKFTKGQTPERFTAILNDIPISGFSISNDDTGIWITFKKGAQ
jgi:ubiquinone/menaquinone biosynthesis C-methylase UbiE